MGLFDQVLGSLGGGGQSQGQSGAFGSSSTMVAALLAMLAAKAVTSGGIGNILGGGHSAPAQPTGQSGSGGLGGMLGNILGGGQGGSTGAGSLGVGGLGGLLGGGGIAGGLGQLIEQMHQNGHGEIANSWVGGGSSQSIQPGQLKEAIGDDTLQELSRQSGLSRDEVADQLSHALPHAVDQLTPQGRLPTHDEASQWV